VLERVFHDCQLSVCLLLVSLPSVAYSLDSPAGNVLVSDDAKEEGDRFKEGVFQVSDGKDTGLITHLLRVLSPLDDSEWAESTIVYEVRR
jgi:hypothetical protein